MIGPGPTPHDGRNKNQFAHRSRVLEGEGNRQMGSIGNTQQIDRTQFQAPAGLYAIWGTAEVDIPQVLRPVLEEFDIVVLEDRGVELTLDDLTLWMIGLRCTRDLVGDGARLRELMAEAPAGALTLLLYHTPDLMPQAAAAGVDLYLAGHTHGGQWRIPGFGALITS